ncbi:MAG TPA: hypothetical protein VGY55_15445 [Pirellulales bacterium]|nr:hypothetical protein [Pirellulales bacterium]
MLVEQPIVRLLASLSNIWLDARCAHFELGKREDENHSQIVGNWRCREVGNFFFMMWIGVEKMFGFDTLPD